MNNTEILSELKKCINPDMLRLKFRELAFKCHPDTGGKTSEMQYLLQMYQELLKSFNSKTFFRKAAKNQANYEYTYEYSETAETEFSDKIQELIVNLPKTCTIEVRGSWIWVFGDSAVLHAKKDKLGLKFKESDNEFYWRDKSQAIKKYRGFKPRSREQIRAAYGYTSQSGKQDSVN